MKIKEDLLHYAWQYQVFKNGINLETTRGQTVQVIHVGTSNTIQGPDFLNAKVKIDNVLWYGHVEIHVKSSDWYKHNHHKDPNYSNVILHVVIQEDQAVVYPNQLRIPCVEIGLKLSNQLVRNYQILQESNDVIPCAGGLQQVKTLTKTFMLERLLIERLERKSLLYKQWWLINDKDKEQTMFEVFCYCLGLKLNADNMYELAHSLPLKLLIKHHDNPFQLEALLFGMSGLLEIELKDDYGIRLKQEFDFLVHKYGLTRKINRNQWYFGGVRPSSYVTIRLAQLASILHINPKIFSSMMHIYQYEDFGKLLSRPTNSYWETHYDFNCVSKRNYLNWTPGIKQRIILNGLAPLLFLESQLTNNDFLLNHSINLLETIQSEDNKTLIRLKDYFEMKTARDSQAILELFDYYCSKKACLSCQIGKELLHR